MASRSINEKPLLLHYQELNVHGLAYIGCCWTLVWISIEQINGVVVSFAIAIAMQKSINYHATDLFHPHHHHNCYCGLNNVIIIAGKGNNILVDGESVPLLITHDSG